MEDVRFGNFLAAECHQLIEHRFGVAQPAFRAAGNRVSRCRLERDLLLAGNELQMIRDQVGRNAMKIEALAAAENRGQDLLRFSRRENKFHVRRRFLERLEQGVEGSGSEHVHFVDDVDLEMPFARRVTHVVAQFAHLLDAVVAGAVDLKDIEAVAAGNFAAVVALRRTASPSGPEIRAIQCFRQDSGGRSLTGAARADKQIGVSQTVLLDRILEGAGDVVLADDIIEMSAADIFGRKPDSSRPNLVRPIARENRNQKIRPNFGVPSSIERWTSDVGRWTFPAFAMNAVSRLFAFAFLFPLLLQAREPQPGPPAASPVLRARALDIPFEGIPGPLNAITDVTGVEVGYTTLISGEGKLEVGKGPVRTGVTAIAPRGRASNDPVYAGVFSLNGNGEMTGTAWIEEGGFLEGPVVLTNTHSVGVARDAVIAWRLAHGSPDADGFSWSLPVVAETWDGWLNDINGFHVKPEHVAQALDSTHGGAVEEGSVGRRDRDDLL